MALEEGAAVGVGGPGIRLWVVFVGVKREVGLGGGAGLRGLLLLLLAVVVVAVGVLLSACAVVGK